MCWQVPRLDSAAPSVVFLGDGDVFAHGGLRARRHQRVVVPAKAHPQRRDACKAGGNGHGGRLCRTKSMCWSGGQHIDR